MCEALQFEIVVSHLPAVVLPGQGQEFLQVPRP